MPDYQEMYWKMFRASEEAIRILIEAQRECEECYLSRPQLEWAVLPLPAETRHPPSDASSASAGAAAASQRRCQVPESEFTSPEDFK